MYKDSLLFSGTSYDLDEIYIGWLKRGKQDIFKLECPHSDKKKYYVKGKGTVLLGERMKMRSHDYKDCRVFLEPTFELKKKLIEKFVLGVADTGNTEG